MTTLASSRAKLNRARTHVKAFHRRREAIEASELERVVSNIDEETGEKFFVYQGNPSQLYQSCSVVVGDAIHNYRSALDHLAWSLVEVNGGNPTRATEFPICTSSGHFRRALKRGTLNGMSLEAKEMIESEQPYSQSELISNNLPGGIEYLDEGDFRRVETLDKYWLILLRYLDNNDKHRQLDLTLTSVVGGSFNPGYILEFPEQADYFVHYGIISDGMELARLPKRNKHVDFTPMFGTAFWPGIEVRGAKVVEAVSRKILKGKAVWQVLNSFDNHIERILDRKGS